MQHCMILIYSYKFFDFFVFAKFYNFWLIRKVKINVSELLIQNILIMQHSY